MSKKLLSLALALVMSLALCIPAWAMDSNIPTSTSTEAGTVMQIDQFLNDASFETITREEYIADKASHENISYTEAEQIVDANIKRAERATAPITPNLWEGDTSVGNGDDTVTIYGRVSQIYKHSRLLKAKYYVQAVVIASHYGKTWADCDSTGGADPYGSGPFTFSGSTTARIIDTTRLRMTLDGFFEMSKSDALSLGVDLELFNVSYSNGGTTYLRANVSDTHIETLQQSA